MKTTKPHEYQVAATILQGLIADPLNQMPLDNSHAILAAELARKIVKAVKGDPHLALAAARQVVAFKANPKSKHCSAYELLRYSLHSASLLHKAVHNEMAGDFVIDSAAQAADNGGLVPMQTEVRAPTIPQQMAELAPTVAPQLEISPDIDIEPELSGF